MQNGIISWQDAIFVAGATVLNQLAVFLPSLLGAIVIFLVGWIIGGLARSLVSKILSVIRLQAVIKGTAIDTFVQKAEIKGKVEDAIGGVVKWIIVFIFFIAAINILGLPTVSQVLNSILGYIPRVFSAALVLIAGVLLAGVVESVVKGATGAIDLSVSRFLGKLASWVVMIFSVLAAISELGIAAQFINTLIIGVVATLSLGLGLALGLGSKDIIREILAEWYEGVRRDIKKR